jgi:hypothetical protein
MTPIKLTSTSLDAAEVVVMYDKITHIESAKTVFGDEYARVHLGSDMVEVKETPNQVFNMIAYCLHNLKTEAEEPLDPSFMDVEDSPKPSMYPMPDISLESLIKKSEEKNKDER